MSVGWNRPANVPFPSIWKTFQGKPHADHPPTQYKIQDLTEDYIEGAIQHMVQYFLIRENICSSSGYTEDEVSLKEIRAVWGHILLQRMGLIALAIDSDTGKERIAGVNMTCIVSKNEKDDFNFSGPVLKKVWQFLEDVGNQVDAFEKYKVEHYMTALGLSVAPQYHGDGVGEELLLARTPLCQAVGITLTETVFTGSASQYLATKAGFVTIAEVDFEQYRQGDSKIVFPRLKGKTLLMAKVIPTLSKG